MTMSEQNPKTSGSSPAKRRFRFGLRSLIAAVALLGVAFGSIAREHRRAEQRVALVSELVPLGVRPLLEEPTGLGLFVRKVLPNRACETWIGERIGAGWFSRPTVFVCVSLGDEQVPFVVERLRRLGTVREVQLQGEQLTERGASELRSGLPGVGVVASNDPALQRYYHEQVDHEHAAVEGAALAALLAIGLLGILGGIAWTVVRRVRTKRVEG